MAGPIQDPWCVGAHFVVFAQTSAGEVRLKKKGQERVTGNMHLEVQIRAACQG